MEIKRMDDQMPFLLRYENVAWYEDGAVRILDRRIFPTKREFVTCTEYAQVAQAIADMVTQSAGPYTAVGMGMALAAYQAKDKPAEEQKAFLQKAAKDLANARPTTANRYAKVTGACLEKQIEAIDRGESAIDAAVDVTIASLNRRYGTMQLVGDRLEELIRQIDSRNPKDIANQILAAAIRQKEGHICDDMTVLVGAVHAK